MFINFLLLFCALSLSTVAAYYSVIGLATIFAGAFWPVVIMGGLLEASKIVVSSWLYRKWTYVPILLKSYLTTAVVILMMITSVGIFGFLSKAHIEQTGQMQENQAQIERFNAEIGRNKFLYQKAEERLKQLETTGTGSDVNIQNQINIEQQRIDSAYQRIQPAIDEQNKIIDGQTKIITDQLADIDKQLETLQKYIDSKEIEKAQSLVGTKADGNFGPGTAAAVKSWQQNKRDEKNALLNKLEDINKNNGIVKAAREEIQRVRQTVELQVAESNKLINRLREQVGKTKVEDIASLINEQQGILKQSSQEIDKISEKKFLLESQYRKLEAEVGPIKYIANFIYDNNSDKNLLEKSVTWMIIIIILVFDPLAVLMVIAANLGFMLYTPSSNSNTSGNQDPNQQDNKSPDDSKLKSILKKNLKISRPPLPVQPILNVNKDRANIKSESVIQTISERVTTITSKPVIEAVSEPVIETVPEPVIETVPEPVIEAVSEPVIEAVSEPVIEAVSEPVVETVPEPVIDYQISKNNEIADLTVIQPVLQSAIQEDKIEPKMNNVHTPTEIIKLNADEILDRISQNRPVVRYDAKREWNGYKH